MKIAVEGCAHGELDIIYDTIKFLEENEKIKVDLLICCGDFQSSRSNRDLDCMAVPAKYRDLCSFYKYYNGEKIAPILTIFIGGNHEASNYLQELPYGGWVAPNIYYLGYAGVINIAGIRIAGLSGIYKNNDYLRGHYEIPPYNEYTVRSVYHVRNLEVFRLKQISEHIDICLSHDWPTGVTDYGNCNQLIKFKPHFESDIRSGKLGNPHTEILLKHLKPSYWFAAHLHCKFAALIPHSDKKTTKFLALDKCLPNRRFLQILDIPHDPNMEQIINYDLEWLTILHLTNHLLNAKNVTQYMPGPNGSERFNFTPTKEEKAHILNKFENNLVVPTNFERTQPGHNSTTNEVHENIKFNPQTRKFCQKLEVDDPIEQIAKQKYQTPSTEENIEINSTQTFINDSEIFDDIDDVTSQNTSINRSFKMNLPEPKNNSECLDLNETNGSVAQSISPLDSSNIEETKQKPDYNLTPIKKFKRRNADIYTDIE